jgi:hypothetical protein
MATPSPTTATPKTSAGFIADVREPAKPYLVPYYLTVAAVIGAITTVFVVMTVLIILVATNFNVLGLIE